MAPLRLVLIHLSQQAIWFLNAFWETHGEANAEKIWAYAHKHNDLDLTKGKEGCELDELNAHRFLEAFDETMTVREMRNQLRAKGALKVRTIMQLLSFALSYATCRNIKWRRRCLSLIFLWCVMMSTSTSS